MSITLLCLVVSFLCLLTALIVCPLVICVCAYRLQRCATADKQRSGRHLRIVIFCSVAVQLLSAGGFVISCMPASLEAQDKMTRDTCREHLEILDKSIQLAQANGLVVTSIEELIPRYLSSEPRCPSGVGYCLTNLHGSIRAFCSYDDSHTYR